jgi:hypothetical protein
MRMAERRPRDAGDSTRRAWLISKLANFRITAVATTPKDFQQYYRDVRPLVESDQGERHQIRMTSPGKTRVLVPVLVEIG